MSTIRLDNKTIIITDVDGFIGSNQKNLSRKFFCYSNRHLTKNSFESLPICQDAAKRYLEEAKLWTR